MFKKVSILLAVVLALTSFAFPVFGQDDPYADVDPSGATVEFWHQHSAGRARALDAMVAVFNDPEVDYSFYEPDENDPIDILAMVEELRPVAAEYNPYGIVVEASNQGGYGDIFQKMNLGLVAGGEDLPQLVVAYGNQAATYQLVDGLVDMNTLVESPTWGLSEEERADFFPAFIESDIFSVFDDARLGFPPNRSMEVMYYNASWLAELFEAGAISFEGPPTTPDQFREAACAATENPFSGATGDVSTSVGYQLSLDASRFAAWTFGFGGDVFDEETNQYTYDSEAAVAAMEFLQGLFNDGCAAGVEERFGDQTNFGAGVTLFTVGSSSGLPFYELAVRDGGADFEWSVSAVPHVTEDPVQNIYGASVSMPRSTPEQELATWIFIKYYTSPEVQTYWAEASNYFPVRQSVAEGEEMQTYFEANPAYAAAFDLLPYTKVEPQVPGYDFVRDLLEQQMAAIVSGSSVTETLAATNVEANRILAEQFEDLE